jgi:hypothetical protein
MNPVSLSASISLVSCSGLEKSPSSLKEIDFVKAIAAKTLEGLARTLRAHALLNIVVTTPVNLESLDKIKAVTERTILGTTQA